MTIDRLANTDVFPLECRIFEPVPYSPTPEQFLEDCSEVIESLNDKIESLERPFAVRVHRIKRFVGKMKRARKRGALIKL